MAITSVNVDKTLSIKCMDISFLSLVLNECCLILVRFYTEDTVLSTSMQVHQCEVIIKDSYYDQWGSDDNYIINLINGKINDIIDTNRYVFEDPAVDETTETSN